MFEHNDPALKQINSYLNRIKAYVASKPALKKVEPEMTRIMQMKNWELPKDLAKEIEMELKTIE